MESERSGEDRDLWEMDRETQFLRSLLQQISVFFKSTIVWDKPQNIKQKTRQEEKTLTGSVGNSTPEAIRPVERVNATTNSERETRSRRVAERMEIQKPVPLPSPNIKSSEEKSEDSIEMLSIEEIYPNDINTPPRHFRNHREESDSEDYMVKAKKKNRKKRNRGDKCSNSPKKPVSSFVHYYAARTKQLRLEHPEGVVGNLAKILSAEWKTLSEKEKEPYIKAASDSLETYYNEKKNGKNMAPIALKQPEALPEFEPLPNSEKQDEVEPSEILGRKKENSEIMLNHESLNIEKKYECLSERDEKLLKKGPLSNFFIFFKTNCDRIAEQYNENQRGKLAKLASEEWKKMSHEDKRVYTNMAKVERRRKEKLERQLQEQEEASNVNKIDRNERRKKKDPSHEQEYRPKVKRHPQISAQLERENLQSNKHEVNESNDLPSEDNNSDHLNEDPFYLYLDTKNLKMEADHNCEIKMLLQEDSYSSKQKNLQLQKIKEENEEVSESCEKSYEKLPAMNFIEVNSSDGGCVLNNSSENVSFSKEILTNIQKEKAPVNAFLIYYQQTLKDLKASHNRVLGSELVKIASSKWSEMKEEEKIIYHNLARERKKNHDLYVKAHQSQVDLTRSRLRTKRSELAYL